MLISGTMLAVYAGEYVCTAFCTCIWVSGRVTGAVYCTISLFWSCLSLSVNLATAHLKLCDFFFFLFWWNSGDWSIISLNLKLVSRDDGSSVQVRGWQEQRSAGGCLPLLGTCGLWWFSYWSQWHLCFWTVENCGLGTYHVKILKWLILAFQLGFPIYFGGLQWILRFTINSLHRILILKVVDIRFRTVVCKEWFWDKL